MIRARDGVFTAAESWRCPHCRRAVRPGQQFVVYTPPGGTPWVGCLRCAGVFADLACGRQPDAQE